MPTSLLDDEVLIKRTKSERLRPQQQPQPQMPQQQLVAQPQSPRTAIEALEVLRPLLANADPRQQASFQFLQEQVGIIL
jgi:hypothetical protein